ncbi:MAG: MmgE/PrpD family protein [Stomatobaculum sp.]|nr:MmgE/PrpD family protein [Stomatobaculum sp.]
MKLITEKLAEYVVKLRYEDLPEDVVEAAKKCLFDSLGNMCGGRYTELGKKAVEYIRRVPQLTEGEKKVTLLGGDAVSREDAFTAHAVMARCTDLDDGHRFAMGHPGSVIIPAVFSTAEQCGSSEKDLLAAIVASYDVYARIGSAINPSSYRERGFDATGIVGGIACAAAIGKLCGLDQEEMRNALGIAALFSGGLIEYQNDGSMGKVLCGSFAVRNGMEAVTFAKQGFTGPIQAIEGKKGFLQAFSNDPRPERILKDLGRDFKIRETYFKMHACMRGLHAAVDAVLLLREKYRILPDDILDIEVHTTPFVGRLSKPSPETLIGAQCSLEFALAAALYKGHLSSEAVLEESMHHPEIFDLASRIRLVMDPEIDEHVKKNPSHWGAARIVIRMKDGSSVEQLETLPSGEAEKPFGWEQLQEKYRRLSKETPFEKTEEAVCACVRSLENPGRFRELITLLQAC